MVLGISIFGPGGPRFTVEEIVCSLVEAATEAGLDEGDARDAVASGIASARKTA